MPANRNSELVRRKTGIPEDEIELIDLLSVVWKWKYLVIGGTIAFALTAAIISFASPKIYSIDMIIKFGIQNTLRNRWIDDQVYLELLENLKFSIDIGSFEKQIVDYIDRLPGNNNLPKKIQFKTDLIKRSKALKVFYDTSNYEQGLLIVDHLQIS